MADYIDSAGVKLNKNADLIIEADESGAVTSCRNIVTGTEYAGGGGGNLSIATLTIINNVATDYDSNAPIIINNSYAGTFVRMPEGTSTHKIILYNNSALFYITAFDETFVLTGNIAQPDPTYPEFYISGDATLTINR